MFDVSTLLLQGRVEMCDMVLPCLHFALQREARRDRFLSFAVKVCFVHKSGKLFAICFFLLQRSQLFPWRSHTFFCSSALFPFTGSESEKSTLRLHTLRNESGYDEYYNPNTPYFLMQRRKKEEENQPRFILIVWL